MKRERERCLTAAASLLLEIEVNTELCLYLCLRLLPTPLGRDINRRLCIARV